MDYSTIAFFIAVLIIAGMVSGYLAGLFGIGGGIITVPVLVTIFPYFHTADAVLMKMSVATSLALILPASLMATRQQYRMGNLPLSLMPFWVVWVLLGCVVGIVLLPYVSSHYLKIFFIGYIGFCILYTVTKRQQLNAKGASPPKPAQAIAGSITGSLSVLLGIGGGTFMVPFFQFFDYPVINAIAVSSATGCFIGLFGAIGAMLVGDQVAGRPDFSIGFVNLLAFILLMPTTMLFSPLGAKTANALSKVTLKRLYLGFLIFVFIYMLIKII